MSVVIKDMRMPQGCFDCPFLYDGNICSHTLKEVWNKEEFDWSTERLNDCPLIDSSNLILSHCENCGHDYYPSIYHLTNANLIEICPYCGKSNKIEEEEVYFYGCNN